MEAAVQSCQREEARELGLVIAAALGNPVAALAVDTQLVGPVAASEANIWRQIEGAREAYHARQGRTG